MSDQEMQPYEDMEIRDTRDAAFFWADKRIATVFLPTIGAYGFAVYMLLCSYANNRTGEAWPSIGTLARKLDVSKFTIRKAIDTLEEQRLIRVERERIDPKGDPTSNLYVLLTPKGVVRDTHYPSVSGEPGVVRDTDPNNKNSEQESSIVVPASPVHDDTQPENGARREKNGMPQVFLNGRWNNVLSPTPPSNQLVESDQPEVSSAPIIPASPLESYIMKILGKPVGRLNRVSFPLLTEKVRLKEDHNIYPSPEEEYAEYQSLFEEWIKQSYGKWREKGGTDQGHFMRMIRRYDLGWFEIVDAPTPPPTYPDVVDDRDPY